MDAIQITEDDFYSQYHLINNHLNDNAGWQDEDGNGGLFETYGEELEFVKNANPRTVWTLMDGEYNDMVIVSGFHYVNRIGYFITREEVPENTLIEVIIEGVD